MIRPVAEAERTGSDIIESKFYTASVKRHKIKASSCSYAADNPLTTAGVVLFVMVVFMFLILNNFVASRNSSILEDNKTDDSSNLEIIKTNDAPKESSEDIKNNNANTDESKAVSDLVVDDEMVMYSTVDVEAIKIHKPHRFANESTETDKNANKRLEMTSR